MGGKKGAKPQMGPPRSPIGAAPAFGVTSMFVFWGFFNKATAYTPGRIFTQNTSNDVVPDKEVPFGGPDR